VVTAPQETDAATPVDTIRVLLVDDHALVRAGLKSILETFCVCRVIGEAADGDEAVEAAGRLRPDVILMDITMPRMNGVEATRAIVARMPEARVIALSMHDDERARAAMQRAGARAYLPKDCLPNALCQTIQRVYDQAGKN
jgi:DNA-binding NarL/FixJ family response regulator